VTTNLRDFPAEILEPFGIEAQHPDEFIMHLFDLNADLVSEAARNHLNSLKNPAKTIQQYLEVLEKQGLLLSASALRENLF
jgi:hypothetical protein